MIIRRHSVDPVYMSPHIYHAASLVEHLEAIIEGIPTAPYGGIYDLCDCIAQAHKVYAVPMVMRAIIYSQMPIYQALQWLYFEQIVTPLVYSMQLEPELIERGLYIHHKLYERQGQNKIQDVGITQDGLLITFKTGHLQELTIRQLYDRYIEKIRRNHLPSSIRQIVYMIKKAVEGRVVWNSNKDILHGVDVTIKGQEISLKSFPGAERIRPTKHTEHVYTNTDQTRASGFIYIQGRFLEGCYEQQQITIMRGIP